jgi:hypothetical protein
VFESDKVVRVTNQIKAMTQAEYIRRIERLFRACEWRHDNPYQQVIRERVESGRAEFAAEVENAKSAGGCEF